MQLKLIFSILFLIYKFKKKYLKYIIPLINNLRDFKNQINSDSILKNGAKLNHNLNQSY